MQEREQPIGDPAARKEGYTLPHAYAARRLATDQLLPALFCPDTTAHGAVMVKTDSYE